MARPMLKHALSTLCLSLFASAAAAQSEPAPEALEAPPERILVVGQKPGPGLWKVSKDDHVMYVFGTYGPLPRKLEWRSREVESIIAQSQEFLNEPRAGIGLRFGMVAMLPFAFGVKNNPGGKVLRDLLPAATYERWLVLRKKYLKDDDGYERQRPLFVADELASKATAAAGLTNSRDVRQQLVDLAKKNKVKVTSTGVSLPLDSPVKAIRDFRKTALDDVPCFETMIARLDTDVDTLRARADAWARGDIVAIRALDFADKSCVNAIQHSTIFKERGLDDMEQRIRAAWLAAAEKSLAANRSTFAVLPIKDILGGQQYLAALEQKGYKVEQPE